MINRMRASRLFVFYIFILVFSRIETSLAEDPVAKIKEGALYADEFTRNSIDSTIELKGHVKLIYKSRMITCDSAKIFEQSQKLQAYGNVMITDNQITMNADEIYYDYENNTGLMKNAFVRSGQVMFEGSLIHKISENEFIADDAVYTTCQSCPASWEFSGKRIKAELGGYAHIQKSFVHIGGIPIFWFPYLVVPLKSNRQSGLLPPEFNYSNTGGLAISESYFKVLSENTDSTITLRNYEKRGLKGLVNYRYRLTGDSQGELDTAWLRDKAFADNTQLNKFRSQSEKNTAIDRWFLKYSHYHELPEDFIQRANINLASDLQYFNDFSKETKNPEEPAMENRISVTKNTENTHFSVDSSYYINLFQENPKANNDNAVHRFPEIQYNLVKQPLWENRVYLDIDMNHVNFTRSSSSFDKLDPSNKKPIEDTGIYDPANDLIRTGQRFDFSPQISKPFYLGQYFDIFPKISYRETQYQFNIDNYNHVYRRYLRYEMRVRSTASRIFSSSDEKTTYRHEIQPEVIANYVPWIDQGVHPFFGSEKSSVFFNKDVVTDNDLFSKQKLQFDYKDRLYDKNIYNIGINNTLTAKRINGDSVSYDQVASFKISRNYDVQRSNEGRNPWSDIESLLDIRYYPFELYATVNYFPEVQVANTSTRLRYTDTKQNFYQIQVLKNELDLDSQTLDYTFAAGFHTRYLNLVGKVSYDAITKSSQKIKSWGYIAQFKPPGDCWLINIINEQPTGGDPSIYFNFDFIFDGIQKTLLTPQDLEKIR